MRASTRWCAPRSRRPRAEPGARNTRLNRGCRFGSPAIQPNGTIGALPAEADRETIVTNLRKMMTSMLAAATLAGSLAAPAGAQQRWDWGGGRPGQRELQLVGVGVRDLLPELRGTNRGRAFVLRNFDRNGDGRVNRVEAEAANRAFLGIAGNRRDRFDWDARDVEYVRVDDRGGNWDRRGMRDYRLKQTRYGATLVLQDVLFQTASARLRPAAAERLRPLAGYLRANPGVQVRIDGHTDSQGSDASNQLLSEARADAVAGLMDELGVRRRRILVAGHGETMPVATNATAAGRQLNRRVEVTLVGRQAREFDRID